MAPRTGYAASAEASTEDVEASLDDHTIGSPLVFPLIERSFDRGPHAGQIALPGGRMEVSDRSLTTTALREASEEVSLDPAHVTVLGSLSPFYLDVSNYLVTPIVGWVDDPLLFHALAPQPREVSSIMCGAWPAMAQTRALRIVRARGTTMQTASYRVGAHTVWGATAMILNELFTLLGHYTSAGSTYEGSSSGREK
jgi:8-oxo-dGTP pyrophosphatase MutT (NUDIX family)